MTAEGIKWTDVAGAPGEWATEAVMDGRTIGEVVWFYDGGPYYPHTFAKDGDQRYGAISNLAAAKDKVEAQDDRTG